jgi:signal peptidase I
MNDNYQRTDQMSAPQPALESESKGEQATTEPTQSVTPAPGPSTQKFPPAYGPQGIQFVISVLVIVVFMITFVIQAFRVPSESMENTLLIGDFLLADKLHFANDGGIWHWLLPYRSIRRGDVVVFRYPVDPSQYFVKRVIGLPGDRIRLQNKIVYVNGSPLDESYVIHSMPNFEVYRDNFPLHERLPLDVNRQWIRELSRHLDHGELVVPKDEFFVMGDNRDQSLDSRYWGFVPRGNIMGRPLVIYLSINDGHPSEAEPRTSNGKLFDSGQVLAHFLQLARWDRIFRRVL